MGRPDEPIFPALGLIRSSGEKLSHRMMLVPVLLGY